MTRKRMKINKKEIYNDINNDMKNSKKHMKKQPKNIYEKVNDALDPYKGRTKRIQKKCLKSSEIHPEMVQKSSKNRPKTFPQFSTAA